MKTKLPLILITSAIFIVGFYFLYSKPHAREVYAQNRDRCYELGAAKYSNDLSQKQSDVTMFTPKYIYKEVKQQGGKGAECIYIGGAVMSEGVTEEYIYDIYSGKRLAWYVDMPNKKTTLGDKAGFEFLKKEYDIN